MVEVANTMRDSAVGSVSECNMNYVESNIGVLNLSLSLTYFHKV